MAANDLYSPALLEHSSDPDYKYEMDCPTHSHEGVNPSCGDDLVLSLRINDAGVIEEAAFTGSGCAVSQASADMMSDLITGMDAGQARDLCELFKRMARGEETNPEVLEDLGDAACLKSVARMPARVKCAELAWRTLGEMLDERAGK
jgi:nitrogen fixation NifU-like protein